MEMSFFYPLPVLQVLCVEREINRLNEVYQQLSSELHRATHIRSPPEQKESMFDKPLQVRASGDPNNPHNVGGSAKCIYIVKCVSHSFWLCLSRSPCLQEQQIMLELQKCTVEQRLKEMRDRLSKLSPNEDRAAQKDSQTPSKRKPDNTRPEKQTPATGKSSNKKKQSKHMDKDEEKRVTA